MERPTLGLRQEGQHHEDSNNKRVVRNIYPREGVDDRSEHIWWHKRGEAVLIPEDRQRRVELLLYLHHREISYGGHIAAVAYRELPTEQEENLHRRIEALSDEVLAMQINEQVELLDEDLDRKVKVFFEHSSERLGWF